MSWNYRTVLQIVTCTAQLHVHISHCCWACAGCSIFSNLTGLWASIGVTHSYSSCRSCAHLLVYKAKNFHLFEVEGKFNWQYVDPRRHLSSMTWKLSISLHVYVWYIFMSLKTDVHEFPDCSRNGHTCTNSDYQAIFLHLGTKAMWASVGTTLFTLCQPDTLKQFTVFSSVMPTLMGYGCSIKVQGSTFKCYRRIVFCGGKCCKQLPET